MRVERTFGQREPGFHVRAIFNEQAGGIGYVHDDLLTLFVGDDDLVLFLFDRHTPAMLGDDGGFFLGGEDVASLNFRFILGDELPIFRDGIFIVDHFGVFDADLAHVGVFFRLGNMHHTADLGDNGFAFRLLARFEDFFHARETGRDVGTSCGCHTTGVEGAQRELCTRLPNGLGGDDTDSRAELHHFTAAKVDAVAFGTDAVFEFAGHRRTEFHFR